MQSNTMYKQHNKPNRGTTLIEVMISLLVFALLTVIFASAVVMAKVSSKVNGQYAQALSLCQHKIDQLRAVGFGRLNYEELNDAGIVDDSPTGSPYRFDAVDSVSTYLPESKSTLKTALVSDSNDMVMQVTVTISWKATANRDEPSTASISAYIVNVE